MDSWIQEVKSLRGANSGDLPEGLLPHSRRGFLAASALAGFAAAVAPTGALQAQVITTSDQGLTTGMVKLTGNGSPIDAYFARPAQGKNFKTIIVVQEIFGVHEHIKDVCRRFAQQGYLAVAPEFFQRQGDPTKYDSVPALFQNIVSKVPDAQVLGDVRSAMAWARTEGRGSGRVGITGFCWGGRIVWMASAAIPEIRAGVAWYGRLRTTVTSETPVHPIDVVEKLKWPVLGLYGGADSGIPNADVEEMKFLLSTGPAAAQASDIILYPDTPHAFHADYRPSYRKEQAEDAWKRCLAWFAKTIA